MSVRHGGAPRRRTAAAAGLLALGLVGAGCSSQSQDQASPSSGGSSSASPSAGESSAAPVVSTATVATNVARHDVTVDKVLKLTAHDGTFESVTVVGPHGKPVTGRVSADKTTWSTRELLEPGARYRITTVAVDGEPYVQIELTHIS